MAVDKAAFQATLGQNDALRTLRQISISVMTESSNKKRKKKPHSLTKKAENQQGRDDNYVRNKNNCHHNLAVTC